LPAHRARLVRKVRRVLQDQWVKRATSDRRVPPVPWDHKVLPVRRASLVRRAQSAHRDLQDRREPKATWAFKGLPAPLVQRARQVFKVLQGRKE
jgi:hypothetical protein